MVNKTVTEPTNCKITINGSRAVLSGIFPVDVVRKSTSFYVEGYKFHPLFRQKKWDGRKHLFNKITKAMPAGLVNTVVAAIKEYEASAKIEVVDDREKSIPVIGNTGYNLVGISFGEGVFDYQMDGARALVSGRRGILKIATNGGKTEIACAVTKHLAVPTIFLVNGLELLHQTRKRFALRLGIPLESIGIIGDGDCIIGDWITVATPGTLGNRLTHPDVVTAVRRWQLLWADECHHAAAETFFEVMDALPCYYRFGLSGTPLDRSDGADLRLIAQTGEILYEVANKLLIERGISVRPHVEIIKITDPVMPSKGMTWNEVHKKGIVQNETLNNKIVDKVMEYTAEGLQVLICVDAIAHGNTIDKLIWKRNGRLGHQFINGAEDSAARQKALEQMKLGNIRCLIATSILDEGVDVPSIDVLIFAGGGKAKIRTLQRVGRGLRLNKAKGKDKLVVVDFANFCHKWLLKHSLMRLETYKAEDCFVINTEK